VIFGRRWTSTEEASPTATFLAFPQAGNNSSGRFVLIAHKGIECSARAQNLRSNFANIGLLARK
jgi:hypothetical protein